MEIKFRGMDANGIMRYGRLSQDKKDSTAYYEEYSQRICWDDSNIPVKNITLGQYVGFMDRSGKDIYDGDIIALRGVDDGQDYYYKVYQSFTGTWMGCNELYYDLRDNDFTKCEVIGNKFENPELLEGNN